MMSRTQPGQLDQRITLSSPAEVDDGGGGTESGWAELPEIWARVVPLRGSEGTEAERQTGVVVYAVTIRPLSVPGGVKSDMRLVWNTNGDVVLNVREVPDGGPRDAYLTFTAERGVSV